MVETHREYLGDGVYAAFDGYQVWLRTLEGNQIALEPAVFVALEDYVRRLKESVKPPSGIVKGNE